MKEYWYGDQPLIKTFWLLWVGGSLMFAFLGAAFVFASGLIFQFPSASAALLTFLLLALFNPYYIFCWVSTWRATKNTSFRVAEVGVKLLVVIHVTYVIYSFTGIDNVLQNSI